MAPVTAKPDRKRRHHRSPSPNQNALPLSMQAASSGKKLKLEQPQKDVLHAYNTRSRLSRDQARPLPTTSHQSTASSDSQKEQLTATGSEMVVARRQLGKKTSSAAPPVGNVSSVVSAPLAAPPGRFLSPEGLQADDNGHLVVREGDIILRRYQVLRALGSGTFGQVVAVRDLKKRSNAPEFALKITQATKDAAEDWKFEKDVLFKLNELDKRSRCHLVRLYNAFMYHEHPCLVFEKLSDSLHNFLQTDPFHPLVMPNLCSIARQMCEAIEFLHAEHITHTDLKPENIAFAVPFTFHDHRENHGGRYVYTRTVTSPLIRVIDFGSAVHVDDHHGVDVTTRQYRAPEVMLELGWSYPIDVWSVGCILFEIYTSRILFHGPTVKDQLAIMERTLGPIPPKMLKQSAASALVTKGKFMYDGTEDGWAYVQKHAKPLKDYMRDQEKSTIAFFELLTAMLRFDPRYRITMSDALRHPFFASVLATKQSTSSTIRTKTPA
ncbi:Dual specificity protein kinase CLK3 [Hypsibius exemplaris]|uniref:Dual specificity protein kinase CLK3 n=1 Tax=Hypsibius exemplaris TaxID=2072580 RepID=A0A1W0WWK3_HYPEX|nr:Dual specificity protein kinase CLK3 [Hypsibius exemplaris]